MDFFGYYTIDDPAKHPFMMFSTTHLLFIILIICCLYLGLKVSKDYPEEKIKKIIRRVTISNMFFRLTRLAKPLMLSPKEFLP